MTVGSRQSGIGSHSRQSQSAVGRLTVALAVCVGLALAVLHGGALQPAKAMMVYIGTYTGAKSQGIYVSRLDLAAGTLSAPALPPLHTTRDDGRTCKQPPPRDEATRRRRAPLCLLPASVEEDRFFGGSTKFHQLG